MDVAQLSEMLLELMLTHDSLGLPGLGKLSSTELPASVSADGTAIYPPRRVFEFKPEAASAEPLAELLSQRVKELTVDDSRAVINSFSEGLRRRIDAGEVVDFPGLGRLSATRAGTILFVLEKDLDVSPAYFGLGPIELVQAQDPDSAESKKRSKGILHSIFKWN